MLDLMCFEYYTSSETTLELALENNQDLSEQPLVLPAGVVVSMPEWDRPSPSAIKLYD